MEEERKLPKWINEVIELVVSTNYEKTWSREHISITPVLRDPDDGYGGRWKAILKNDWGFETLFLWKLVDISRKYKIDIKVDAEAMCYEDGSKTVVEIIMEDPLHAPEREKLDEELERKLKALEGRA